MREDRPAHEPEHAAAGGPILFQHVRAGDVGRHQVGRELDPPERQRQRIGQRLDEQRLGQAGDTDEQAVPAREQRHQQMIDDLLLTHDGLPISAPARGGRWPPPGRRPGRARHPERGRASGRRRTCAGPGCHAAQAGATRAGRLPNERPVRRSLDFLPHGAARGPAARPLGSASPLLHRRALVLQ